MYANPAEYLASAISLFAEAMERRAFARRTSCDTRIWAYREARRKLAAVRMALAFAERAERFFAER